MGFPIGFTEVEDADAEKARSRAALRGLQRKDVPQADQRTDGGSRDIPEAEILQSEVHGEGIDEGESDANGAAQEGCPAEEVELRTVRNRREPWDSPQGSGLEKQRVIQPADIVRQLSHLIASCERRDRSESERAALSILRSPDIEAVCLQYLSDADQALWDSTSRDDKTALLIEAGTAARAMSSRTKRLKVLGNAVVPDCAEWIGRQILQLNLREEKGDGKETAGCGTASSDQED